jgi:hypothetical protein
MTSRVKRRLCLRSLFDLAGHRFPSVCGAIFAGSEAITRFACAQAHSARQEIDMDEAQQLADRYVAVWNETDPERRRSAIAALWAPDGRHYVAAREAEGYEALEERIVGSHQKNVRDGGHRFRAARDARALREVVTFHWEMLPAGGESVAVTGLEVLLVDGQGRIRVDYQFVL